MIWKEKRILLIILGLLLAANAVFFLTYRVQYQNRLDELDARLEKAEGELQAARNARVRVEQDLQSYAKVEGDVATIFDQHWSTQQQRLTAVIVEVKRLASASGLVPPSYNFDKRKTEKLREEGRAQSVGASEVGIAFGVEGTYAQARRLINLLELSRQFVIIDEIALAAAEDQTLSLTLHVKTLFRDRDTETAARDSGRNL
jgi:Tfp pilus assembly protein PilO